MQQEREVSFAVNCAGTRPGLHVRVVGNCEALGSWRPQSGLPLLTNPAEFPTWRSNSFTRLPEDEVVEYKYVICDGDGNPVRWEDRANRTMNLKTLVGRGAVPSSGRLSVIEAFDTASVADDLRFRWAATSPLECEPLPSERASRRLSGSPMERESSTESPARGFAEWLINRPPLIRMGVGTEGLSWDHPVSKAEKRDLLVLQLFAEQEMAEAAEEQQREPEDDVFPCGADCHFTLSL